MIQNLLKHGNRSVCKLPSGGKVSMADKMNFSFHMILGQTAELLYSQDVGSFTETDKCVGCQGIICLVWKSNSISILAKNRY